jgi:hypothetical protein
LREALRAARYLLDSLRSDPLLLRLVDVYARMPREDREVIVTILDREVTLRRMAKTSSPGRIPINSINVCRVNPNARLYVRVHEPGEGAPYLSREEMMNAMLRAARAMHLTLATTEPAGNWQAGIRDALERLSAAELEAVGWVNRHMLELVEEAAAREAAAAEQRSL